MFARSAPFPRWARLCFVLGHFSVYEYGVISRNYSIGILFLFAAAAPLPRRHERPWLLGLLLARAGSRSERMLPRLAGGLLFVHVALAAIAVREEVSSVFSAGLASAALLVANDLDELPIVADPDAYMTSLLGYLPQRVFYYPRGSRFDSFTRYDKARIDVELSDEQLIAAARDLGRDSRSAVAIVVARPLPPGIATGVAEIGCASADLIPPESFCVYRLPAPS